MPLRCSSCGTVPFSSAGKCACWLGVPVLTERRRSLSERQLRRDQVDGLKRRRVDHSSDRAIIASVDNIAKAIENPRSNPHTRTKRVGAGSA